MGFWGMVVVARTGGLSLLELDPVLARSEGLEREEERGAWRVGVFPGGELESAAPELHLELVEVTGAPVLTAFILDSDCAVIEAAGPSTGFWRSCLAREAMQAYEDDEDDEEGEDAFGELYLPPEQAAAATVAWAQEAGWEVDQDEFRLLFDTEPELFVDGLVSRFVEALGLPRIGAEVDRTQAAAPPAVAGARTVRRHNPVDRLVHEVAVPLLEPLGFVRQGRVFARTTPGGDLIEVLADAKWVSAPDDFAFETDVAVTPVAHAAWQEAGLARAYLARPVRMGVPPPTELAGEYAYPGSMTWAVSPQSGLSWDAAAVAWERSLTDYVLPALARLDDPRLVTDLLADPRHRVLQDWNRDQFFPALGIGPSWQLDLVLSHLEQTQAVDDTLMTWATRWVQQHHGAPDGWRQDRRTGPLAELLDQVVRALAPTLQAHGLARRGTTSTFSRSNRYGDLLLVTVGPAFAATAEQPVVLIELSVLPALEWEWRRRPDAHRQVALEPVARDGWSYRRLSPPQAFALESAPFPDLDLWRMAVTDGVPSKEHVAALVESLAAQLPAAEQLLDRDHLIDLLVPPDRRIARNPSGSTQEENREQLERRERNRQLRIGAPSFLHCEALLSVGVLPDEEVIALLATALQDPVAGSHESSFLSWVRSRLSS